MGKRGENYHRYCTDVIYVYIYMIICIYLIICIYRYCIQNIATIYFFKEGERKTDRERSIHQDKNGYVSGRSEKTTMHLAGKLMSESAKMGEWSTMKLWKKGGSRSSWHLTSKHVKFYQETWEINPETLSFELETNWELPCFKNTKWTSFKKQLVIVIPAKPGELLTVGQHWNGDLAKI